MACGAQLLGMVAGATVGAAAMGQTVECRVVERRGQVTMLPGSTNATTDNVLDFGVQARVVGGGANVGLRSFEFDIVMPCERDAFGTLATERISNADGTYVTGLASFAASSTVGLGGLAAPYCFLAAADANANGLINGTQGTIINNVNAQEIRHVRGLAKGSWLLKVVDGDGNGIPDTSPLNGSGSAPDGSTAELDANTAQQYFGAGGQFVDVYHFRYTRTATELPCPYVLQIQIQLVNAPTLFSQMDRTNGVWGATQIFATGQIVTALNFVPCLGGTNCAADYDKNLSVNVNDIFVFIADWFAGCVEIGTGGCDQRSADFDCDGRLTVADLFGYLTRWFQGC